MNGYGGSATPTFESVSVGDALPGLTKCPNLRQLVRWAGASGDFTPIHYDTEFATQSASLPGIIVHGPLKTAFLVEMLTAWAGGDPAALKGIRLRFLRTDVGGTTLHCRGVVESKDDPMTGEVSCAVWIETEDGKRSVTGTARVVLPRGDE